MNVLITGGFGHIGSYLLNSINKIKKIKNVCVIDNNSNNRINTLFKFKKKIQQKKTPYWQCKKNPQSV